jgi:hypothetical protein
MTSPSDSWRSSNEGMRARALRMWLGSQILAALALSALPVPAWSANADQDILVRVLKDGQNITVDVDCPVDAPWSLVWEVLTDYDHMAEFVSNLEFSGVKYA